MEDRSSRADSPLFASDCYYEIAEILEVRSGGSVIDCVADLVSAKDTKKELDNMTYMTKELVACIQEYQGMPCKSLADSMYMMAGRFDKRLSTGG